MSVAGLDEIIALGRIEGVTGLKITAVEPVLMSYRYPPEHEQRFSGGALVGCTTGFIRVRAGDQYGIGETYAGYWNPDAVIEWTPRFAEVAMGMDPADIVGVWDACVARAKAEGRGVAVGVAVLGALESALWDLCGKALGVPAYELLGGKVHDRLPRYASGGNERPLEDLAEELRGYQARGFPAAKIRGGVDLEHDVNKVAFARDVVGSSIGIALDQVQGTHHSPWSVEEAIRIAKALEPYDLAWIEEPCPVRDIEAYKQVRRSVATPISGAESCISYERFLPFLENAALDIIQPDAGHAGGMLEIRKVAHHAEKVGMQVAVHAWAASPLLMANYHVGFASPATAWLEFPPQPNPFVEGFMVEPLSVDEDGKVIAPTAPGLGVDVTVEQEEQYPYDPACRYTLG